jgi:hypothetical protein
MILTPKEDFEKLTYGSQKKIKAKCDSCGKFYHLIYRNYFNSQKKRNFSGKTFCSSCAVSKSNQNRPKNSKNWYISGDGYKMIKTGKKINGIGWKAYTKEHKLILEKKLGRPLKTGEIVHHLDSNKLNNSENNLVLFGNGREHRAAHVSLEKIGLELYKQGLVEFDYNSKKYVANLKLRELLGHPVEGNQQPSVNSNVNEGSETSSASQEDNNSTTSAGSS